MTEPGRARLVPGEARRARPISGLAVAARAARRFGTTASPWSGSVFIVIVVVISADLRPPGSGPRTRSLQHLDQTQRRRRRSPTGWAPTTSGRDILSRLIQGTRVSMQVCLGVDPPGPGRRPPARPVVRVLGGLVDSVIMRVTDAMFTIPVLALALAVAALLGPSIFHTSIAIAVGFVPGFVRIVRGQTLAVREEPYIEASRSVGISQFRMLRRHVLPNVAAPLIVQVAVSFGYALLAEAGSASSASASSRPTPAGGPCSRTRSRSS